MIAGSEFRLFLLPGLNKNSVRVGVWNGRLDYSSEPPIEFLNRLEKERVYLVQVARPTNGFEGRSSARLTHTIAETSADAGVVYWARDAKTFWSIVAELSKASGVVDD